MLAGTWINCVLVSVEVFAVVTYFEKHRPKAVRKWVLMGMLGNDLAQSAVICVTVYLVRLTPHFPIGISLNSICYQYVLVWSEFRYSQRGRILVFIERTRQ